VVVDGHRNWVRALRQSSPTPLLIFAAGFAAYTVHHLFKTHWSLGMAPVTVVGAALSIYLAFRNNTVYDRYWEGRGLWGRLVNASRTLVGQMAQFVPAGAGDDFRNALLREQIAFVHCLRCQLRREEPWREIEPFISAARCAALRSAPNVAAALVTDLRRQVGVARADGLLDGYASLALDATLTELAAVQGGCERIRNTPVPPVYTHLAHRIVIGYCLLLPFCFVNELGLLTPFVVVAISYTFLVLDWIGLVLEEPFGVGANCLPLSALSRTIEIELRHALGEKDLPDPLQPVDGVLV